MTSKFKQLPSVEFKAEDAFTQQQNNSMQVKVQIQLPKMKKELRKFKKGHNILKRGLTDVQKLLKGEAPDSRRSNSNSN